MKRQTTSRTPITHPRNRITGGSIVTTARAERAANAAERTPVINFATTPQPRGGLAALIEAFNAAERALGFAIDVDEAIPGSKGAARVMGGVNPAGRIMFEGRADVELPAHEWFYRSLEEIDRDRKLTLQNAKTRQERSEIQSRFSGYRAEFLRQQKELAAPKAKRDAERKLSEAHRALSAAENEIINYRPADLAEAAALLSHAGVDKRHSCFTCDEGDLRNIMRNVAETIRRAEQRA